MNNKDHFNECGYRVFNRIIPVDEIEKIREIFETLRNNIENVKGAEKELPKPPAKTKKKSQSIEINRPSELLPEIKDTKTYQKALKIARELMGEDMEVDFDIMTDQAAGSNTITPWSQDAARWPGLDDKRALSFWIALDDTDQENGYMMYIHGSHKEPMKEHVNGIQEGTLQCDISADDHVVYGEIPAGNAIVHHGSTIYGALGNTSKKRQRRAWLIQFKPGKMVAFLKKKKHQTFEKGH